MEEFDLGINSIKNLAYSLLTKLRGKEMPVFLCVGSDKFVCDSLAPIVSEMLTKKYNIPAYVYGSLDYNINAQNLTQAVNYIQTYHPSSPIVLIDATLGANVGKIILSTGGYAGMGKVMPIKKVGDISILGVVGRSENFELNSTRLNVILGQAKAISLSLAFVCDRLQKEKQNRKMYLQKLS